jgi:1-pyrroline-5-carboxylate dehydrogenase
MGALFMGNKVLIKADSKVSICLQEFVRLLHACGMPHYDAILVHTNGPNMEQLITEVNPRMTCFTGSSHVGERLSKLLGGRIKLEDAGFDWKILGPDVSDVDYVAHISDQDAYAISGQKCSAQSMLFVHKNWADKGFYDRIKHYAELRSLKNQTISPVLTWNNKRLQEHVDCLLKIPGAKLLFGGEPVSEQHSIPDVYGSFKPTAVFIPLQSFENIDDYKIATKEVFGPVQVVTEYTDKDIDHIFEIMNRFDNYLTAGVVSNDKKFLQKVLGQTVNGVTYSGIRARTTGAPQNHWFGPCGDPRAGGIGTDEAIKLVWSSNREIITDSIFPKNFVVVQS